MYREFLSRFLSIIEKVKDQTRISPDDDLITESIEIYHHLSDEEKDLILQLIRSFGDFGYENRLYFDLMCLRYYKDAAFAEDIAEILVTYEMEYTVRYYYLVVLNRELVMAGKKIGYEKRLGIEKLIVESIRQKIADFPEYISYDKRKKKNIVMIMAPFIGIYHSPSQKAVNFEYYLDKLGYNVFFISVNDNDILSTHNPELPFLFGTRNALFNGVKEFEYNCFGRLIKGLHFDLRADRMAADMGFLAGYIAGINPEFIIGVEDCNALADLCTMFTDVISMNMVDDLPVTLSEYCLRIDMDTSDNDYNNAPKYGKIILDSYYNDVILPFNRDEDDFTLPKDRFLICIMGNRLDYEIDIIVEKKIRELIDDVPEADVVFIGNCPRLAESMSDIRDRCHFPGYVKRCEDAVAACSLFLNPPRTGGGGGAYMAIKFGVPVYTMKGCDVASYVGDTFIHDSYDDLIPFVKRCVSDPGFYEEMKGEARKYFDEREKVDSLGNTEDFVRKFTSYISAKA